ncbi:hypothetical protein HNQ41_003046 [Texcoconibacillus texcoconensis]|uniref:Uncharacterized protein n=1 Tax=Texcoconibacillus texcoconensis TaxID=1095777 RepID=A0A840QU38_9BACI|nr:hypothetical protein [Texcoconibacillus texcoconensis]
MSKPLILTSFIILSAMLDYVYIQQYLKWLQMSKYTSIFTKNIHPQKPRKS